jgi:single-stranded-DNA-specific exonuclease
MNKGACMRNIKKYKVVLSTDYDADGILSSVVGIKAFMMLDIKFEHVILNNKYPRGVSKHTIDKALEVTDTEETFVFMTADHGSSSIDALKYLKERRKNVYIILTDHHIIPDESALEDVCDEIYNPFYSKCDYNKNLSGAGVLHRYLKEHLEYLDWDSLKPYVVIANLVDQMSMLDKNNISLYKQCENRLKDIQFIQAMLKVSKKKIAHDRWILINLGPLLNSSHRMGNPEVAVRALMGDMNACAKLDMMNRERKRLTTELIEHIEPQIQANKKSLDNMMMVIMPDNAMGSLSGLVAGRVGADLNMPTFVFKRDGDFMKGSARAIQKLPLLDMYKYIKSKSDNTISDFGGHDMANGLRLHWSSESINNFVKYFNMYLLENDIKYTDTIDAEVIDSKDIRKKVSWIEQNRPFGNSKPYPVVEIKDLEILKLNDYAKITILKLTNGIDVFNALYFDKRSIDYSLPITIKGTIEIDKEITIIVNEFEQL